MSKDLKIQLEKQYIKEIMEYFKDHKLDEDNKPLWYRIKDNPIMTVNIPTENGEKKEKYDCTDIWLLRRAIKGIFKLEVEELGYKYNPNAKNNENEFLLTFIDYVQSNNSGEYSTPVEENLPEVIIYEDELYDGLENEDPKKRLKVCKELFKVIFHEIQHHRQYLMTQLNVSNKEALIYAKEFCMQEILEDSFSSIDEDKGNYDWFITENNANIVARKKYKAITRENDSMLDFKIIDLEDSFYNGVYVLNAKERFGEIRFKHRGVLERNDAAVKVLDKTITSDYIKFYPILQKEYNLNGSRKRAIQLIKNLNIEIMEISSMDKLDENIKQMLITDTKEMYYEIIYKALEKNPLINIYEMEETLGIDKSNKLLEEMREYFDRELLKRRNKKLLYYKEGEKFNKDDKKWWSRYNKFVERINRYYDKKNKFLLYLLNELYKITPQSIIQDTINANIGKSEIEANLVDLENVQLMLKLKQSEIEEVKS